jgi:hypothetical protein
MSAILLVVVGDGNEGSEESVLPAAAGGVGDPMAVDEGFTIFSMSSSMAVRFVLMRGQNRPSWRVMYLSEKSVSLTSQKGAI